MQDVVGVVVVHMDYIVHNDPQVVVDVDVDDEMENNIGKDEEDVMMLMKKNVFSKRPIKESRKK